MDIADKRLNDLLGNALHDSDIAPSQIPDIDLYMDQIITLFDSHMGSNRRRPEDKLLTKTMVNNYSKEGLIKPIKGKRYSKEHIVQILMVYHLKQVLSIPDTKSILGAHDKETDLVSLYENFLSLKQSLRDELPALVEGIVSAPCFNEMDESEKKLLLVLALSCAGNYLKRLSEQIIDHCL